MGEGIHGLLEKLAAVLVAREKVEARTAGRQKHRIAFGGKPAAGGDGLVKRMGVGYPGTLPVKKSRSLALSLPMHTMALTFSRTSGSISV